MPFQLKRKPILIAGAIVFSSIAALSYWYVFIAGAPQLDASPIENVQGLAFQVKSFYSPAMGETRKYGVILPPEYEKHPQQRYPVIFLLHGGHGDERDYYQKAAITTTLRDLYRTKRLPAALIITPDGNDQRGTSPLWDPDYYDGENGKVATLLGVELVREVKQRYRTISDPQYWAIGGLSSGAWGAFNIGLRHVNQFHIFFSHTGYFIDQSGDRNSPQVFIQELSPQQQTSIRVYLDAGESDEKYLEATRNFHNVLDRLGIHNEFYVFPGGHGMVGRDVGWNYWHKHLTDSLSFVGRQLRNAHLHKET